MWIIQSLNTKFLFLQILNHHSVQRFGCLLHIADDIDFSMINTLTHYITTPEKNFTSNDVDLWDQCPNIFISSLNPRETFEKYEDFLRLHGKGMEHRRYIIRFNNSQHNRFNDFFSSPALHFIADLVVIKEYTEKCELYTHKYVGTTNHSEPTLLDVWYSNNTLEYDRDLFPEKLLNVYGRILNIGAAKYVPLSDPVNMKGMETQFLVEFTKKFNYTLRFDKREVRLGLLFPNQSATGFTKLMINDQIDLISYGLYIQKERTKFGAFSTPTSEITLTCIVPQPRLIDEWMVVHTFKFDTWIILIISYFTLSTVFNLILRKPKYANIIPDGKAATSFQVFRIYIGQPDSFFMKNKDGFLLATFLSCMIIIQTYYTSKLSSSNTVPVYIDNIRTVEDLALSGIPWYTKYYDEIKTMETATTEPLASLYKTFRNISPEETVDMMNAERPKSFGYAINQSFNSKYYTVFDYFTLETLKYFKIIRDYIIRNQYTAFFLRRNSVILPILNEFWSIILQHGFSIHWEIDTMNQMENNIQQYLLTSDRRNTNAQPIRLKQIKGILIIWSCGLGISTIIFLIEIYRNKSIRKKNVKCIIN